MNTLITGFAHTAFIVSDMEKAIQFYHDVFGFEKAFVMNNPENNEPWIVYLHAGGNQFIELFYSNPDYRSAKEGDIGFDHLCLTVTDIHAIAEQIVAAGASLDVPVTQGLDKNWQCWTHDPDGNRIELMQMDPDSLQMNYLQQRQTV